jgi:hypothetical protein
LTTTFHEKAFGASPQGFWLTFPCGLTLSTQFGVGHYCETRRKLGSYEDWEKEFKENQSSDDCEIAIWDKTGDFITAKIWKEIFNDELGDSVAGYVTMEQWLKVVNYLSAKKEE